MNNIIYEHHNSAHIHQNCTRASSHFMYVYKFCMFHICFVTYFSNFQNIITQTGTLSYKTIKFDTSTILPIWQMNRTEFNRKRIYNAQTVAMPSYANMACIVTPNTRKNTYRRGEIPPMACTSCIPVFNIKCKMPLRSLVCRHSLSAIKAWTCIYTHNFPFVV